MVAVPSNSSNGPFSFSQVPPTRLCLCTNYSISVQSIPALLKVQHNITLHFSMIFHTSRTFTLLALQLPFAHTHPRISRRPILDVSYARSPSNTFFSNFHTLFYLFNTFSSHILYIYYHLFHSTKSFLLLLSNQQHLSMHDSNFFKYFFCHFLIKHNMINS